MGPVSTITAELRNLESRRIGVLENLETRCIGVLEYRIFGVLYTYVREYKETYYWSTV